nr:hypothetical protein [Tanacetum cinerariifolium]
SPIWEVIQKGNGLVQVSIDTNGQIRVLPPKIAEEILAREKERKKIKDYLEGLHKGYDRFESLMGQLEIHGACVSTEDANQKFLRSLPSSWSQVSLIMRTKPGVDTLNFDDLYNNLRVFESNLKGSIGSSSSTQNVTFVSSDNTSSTNEVNTAFGVSTSSSHNSQKEGFTSYTNDLMCSFFANQSSGPQLDHEDLKQLPPPMTGNYMPPKSDFGIDESKFTYGPKQSTPSESDAKTSDLDSCESSSSEETLETVTKPVESKPKVINEPKV